MDYRDRGHYLDEDKVNKKESQAGYQNKWSRVNGKLTLARAPGMVQNYNKYFAPSLNGIRNFR